MRTREEIEAEFDMPSIDEIVDEIVAEANKACLICGKVIQRPRGMIRISLLTNLRNGEQKWYYNDRPIHIKCLDLIPKKAA